MDEQVEDEQYHEQVRLIPVPDPKPAEQNPNLVCSCGKDRYFRFGMWFHMDGSDACRQQGLTPKEQKPADEERAYSRSYTFRDRHGDSLMTVSEDLEQNGVRIQVRNEENLGDYHEVLLSRFQWEELRYLSLHFREVKP